MEVISLKNTTAHQFYHVGCQGLHTSTEVIVRPQDILLLIWRQQPTGRGCQDDGCQGNREANEWGRHFWHEIIEEKIFPFSLYTELLPIADFIVDAYLSLCSFGIDNMRRFSS